MAGTMVRIACGNQTLGLVKETSLVSVLVERQGNCIRNDILTVILGMSVIRVKYCPGKNEQKR